MSRSKKPKIISKRAALRRLLELATRISHKVCCYHHRDYVPGKTPDWMCDCKYLLTPEGTAYPGGWDGKQFGQTHNSEQTGCCEAREIVSLARRLAKRK